MRWRVVALLAVARLLRLAQVYHACRAWADKDEVQEGGDKDGGEGVEDARVAGGVEDAADGGRDEG